jgi:hypothetical protein
VQTTANNPSGTSSSGNPNLATNNSDRFQFNQSAVPSGTPPSGQMMNGTQHSGTPPSGKMMNGTRPSGTPPSGQMMNGTPPSGTPPSGT